MGKILSVNYLKWSSIRKYLLSGMISILNSWSFWGHMEPLSITIISETFTFLIEQNDVWILFAHRITKNSHFLYCCELFLCWIDLVSDNHRNLTDFSLCIEETKEHFLSYLVFNKLSPTREPLKNIAHSKDKAPNFLTNATICIKEKNIID